jgi:hypothetical protein
MHDYGKFTDGSGHAKKYIANSGEPSKDLNDKPRENRGAAKTNSEGGEKII